MIVSSCFSSSGSSNSLTLALASAPPPQEAEESRDARHTNQCRYSAGELRYLAAASWSRHWAASASRRRWDRSCSSAPRPARSAEVRVDFVP